MILWVITIWLCYELSQHIYIVVVHVGELFKGIYRNLYFQKFTLKISNANLLKNVCWYV